MERIIVLPDEVAAAPPPDCVNIGFWKVRSLRKAYCSSNFFKVLCDFSEKCHVKLQRRRVVST